MSDHPLFARAYERFSAGAEAKGQGEYRARNLAGLSGRVLELGAGNGLNFAHYPPEVTEVVAVEPEPYLRERAGERGGVAPVNVTLVDGDADALPLPDASVDAVVASLVLCSVPSQARALAELRRVLRPGGELRFYEHVVAHSRAGALTQKVATRLFWRHLAAGCELDRDTLSSIAAAGFVVESVERIRFQGLPHLLGVARAAA